MRSLVTVSPRRVRPDVNVSVFSGPTPARTALTCRSPTGRIIRLLLAEVDVDRAVHRYVGDLEDHSVHRIDVGADPRLVVGDRHAGGRAPAVGHRIAEPAGPGEAASSGGGR